MKRDMKRYALAACLLLTLASPAFAYVPPLIDQLSFVLTGVWMEKGKSGPAQRFYTFSVDQRTGLLRARHGIDPSSPTQKNDALWIFGADPSGNNVWALRTDWEHGPEIGSVDDMYVIRFPARQSDTPASEIKFAPNGEWTIDNPPNEIRVIERINGGPPITTLYVRHKGKGKSQP